MVVQSNMVLCDEIRTDIYPHLIQLFLEIINKGAVTTDDDSIFQYTAILTEKADPLLL